MLFGIPGIILANLALLFWFTMLFLIIVSSMNVWKDVVRYKVKEWVWVRVLSKQQAKYYYSVQARQPNHALSPEICYVFQSWSSVFSLWRGLEKLILFVCTYDVSFFCSLGLQDKEEARALWHGAFFAGLWVICLYRNIRNCRDYSSPFTILWDKFCFFARPTMIFFYKPFPCGLDPTLVNHHVSSLTNFAAISLLQSTDSSFINLHNHLPCKALFISTKNRNPKPPIGIVVSWAHSMPPNHIFYYPKRKHYFQFVLF